MTKPKKSQNVCMIDGSWGFWDETQAAGFNCFKTRKDAVQARYNYCKYVLDGNEYNKFDVILKELGGKLYNPEDIKFKPSIKKYPYEVRCARCDHPIAYVKKMNGQEIASNHAMLSETGEAPVAGENIRCSKCHWEPVFALIDYIKERKT
jgi:hypothetical protein